MTTSETLRVGLIGYGRIGRVHAANLAAHPRVQLMAVHDVVPEASAEAADRYGARAETDGQAIIAADDIDAVAIASPTPTHVDYLQAAVLAGKITFCEKPIDLDIAKVEACRRVLGERESQVMIGFHKRFDPSLRSMWKSVRAGEIGRLESVRMLSRDAVAPPLSYVQESGGQPRDMAIHDLDLVRWMLGEEPALIGATGSVLIEPSYAQAGDTDTLHITMRMTGGQLAHIDNSRRSTYGYDQRLEVFGSRGALEMTNPRTVQVERWSSSGTQQRGPLIDGFIDRYAEAYELELDHFVSAALEGKPFDVGFEDGRRALIMADAALESMASSRFVEVSFDA